MKKSSSFGTDSCFEPQEKLSSACSNIFEDFLRKSYAPYRKNDYFDLVENNAKNEKYKKESSKRKKKEVMTDMHRDCLKKMKALDVAISSGSVAANPTLNLSEVEQTFEDSNSKCYNRIEEQTRKTSKNYELFLKGPDEEYLNHVAEFRPELSGFDSALVRRSIICNATVPPNRIYKRNSLSDVQSQGDNMVTGPVGMFQPNTERVSVNISFSFYAKFLAFLLTLNTLFLFKLLLWDQFLNKYLKFNIHI